VVALMARSFQRNALRATRLARAPGGRAQHTKKIGGCEGQLPPKLYGVRDTRDDVAPSVVGDVIDLFTRRQDAEAMVEAWDRDEPEDAGVLEVVEVEVETSAN
jgi:hypothetical protein